MAKIRKDFEGVVTVDRHVLKAGDTIPTGVRVGGHLVEGGKATGLVKATVEPVVDACAGGCKLVEPLTTVEVERAQELGIPTDVHPERVRGALLGFEVGSTSTPDDVSGQGEDDEDVDAVEVLDVDAVEETAKRSPGRPKKTA